ncbi:MAG: hypothetical protein EBR86_03870 [Planctomycetia bacterium]|nr:hypothetical protein [Planctomycetia bacterium]
MILRSGGTHRRGPAPDQTRPLTGFRRSRHLAWGGLAVVGLATGTGHGQEPEGVPDVVTARAESGEVETAVDQATAVEPMPTGPARPSMLLLDPPPGLRRPPSAEDLEPLRRAFRTQCRDLLRVSRTRTGARMATVVLEEAAVMEEDPCLKWVFLEESIRLAAAIGDPDRIESAVALTTEHFRIDGLRTELDALRDIPLRALAPARAVDVARAAERIAAKAAAEDRPRERATAWGLAADAWKRAGEPERARTASAAAARVRDAAAPR